MIMGSASSGTHLEIILQKQHVDVFNVDSFR